MQLARDFATLPLPRAEIDVRPRGQTLINVETRFSTSTGSRTLPPLTVLGRSVTVSATADRYDWNLGDGSTYNDAGPGSAVSPIRHVYSAAASVRPNVTVTWSGTFRIAGDPTTYPIVGTATTQGEPATLAVRTARSELVAQ